jgi:hypothetical protein
MLVVQTKATSDFRFLAELAVTWRIVPVIESQPLEKAGCQ